MNVGFSIDGKWLTDFIRTRFFYEDVGYDWVVDTVRSMFQTVNDLSDERVEQIAQDVILGRSCFEGNTGDNSFVYSDGKDTPITSDFFKKFESTKKKLKEAEDARKEAFSAWQELALVVKGEMGREYCECQLNIDLLKPTPTEEFIDRLISDNVAPYGFISPNGEFHEVDWCDHEEFAINHVHSNKILEEEFNEYDESDSAKDFLIMKFGWLLLHNPRQGKPILTRGDKKMTKAQRETLFDYYTKYNMKQEANALYEEDKV